MPRQQRRTAHSRDSRQPLYGSVGTALDVGISLRQLYYWVEVLRVVQPVNHRHGRRIFRRFTKHDVAKLKAIKGFVEEGYTLRAATRLAARKGRRPPRLPRGR